MMRGAASPAMPIGDNGRRRLVSARLERLDRQSRAQPHRLPVRLRPLLTRESPIPGGWKAKLMEIEEGEVLLHRFSPTGYSSAVRNPFLRNLEARSGARSLFDRRGGASHLPARRRREAEFLGDAQRPAARAPISFSHASPRRSRRRTTARIRQ